MLVQQKNPARGVVLVFSKANGGALAQNKEMVQEPLDFWFIASLTRLLKKIPRSKIHVRARKLWWGKKLGSARTSVVTKKNTLPKTRGTNGS